MGYTDIEKYDKDIDMVDPGSDGMPDLHGKHVGREARVGSKGKETIMIYNIAYHEGGVWYLDRWWPRMERMTGDDSKNKITGRSLVLVIFDIVYNVVLCQ